MQPNKETVVLRDDKIQPINHVGEHFSAGPLNITRSPQASGDYRSRFFQRWAEAGGRDRRGDFHRLGQLEEAQSFYRSQKDQVIAAGRNPDHVVIMRRDADCGAHARRGQSAVERAQHAG